ncbi:hypothetical protein ScPMuIL_012282 [Solemya velum]
MNRDKMATNDSMDTDSDEWDEEEGEVEFCPPVKCLFCAEVCDSPVYMFEHCHQYHNFNIQDVCQLWNLDCFGYIKMVNFIRLKEPSSSDLKALEISDKPPWDNDEFMRPVNPDDPLLQYDIEDVQDLKLSQTDSQSGSNGPPQGAGDPGGGKPVTMSQTEYSQLMARLHATEQRALSAESEMARVLEDMETMRSTAKELVHVAATSSTTSLPVQALTEEEDDVYFSSYSHFGIHEEMLKDVVRTQSYMDFMYQNKDVFTDKIVLDVGCGTGILSMFAARAGAKTVLAVDQSEIIYQAMDISRANGFGDKIQLFKGRLEDVKLPVDKVDIIISEWMGYFLLFESMLDTVVWTRDRYLQPEGRVYPDVCSISLTATDDLELWKNHVTYWDDVYGFRMTCMKSLVVQEASVEVARADGIISDSCVVKEININKCSVSELDFSSDFTLCIRRTSSVTAIVGSFDAYFGHGEDHQIVLQTGPDQPSTHWKQTVFLLEPPIPVREGDNLKGNIVCQKNKKDPRSLVIQLTVGDQRRTYFMQ